MKFSKENVVLAEAELMSRPVVLFWTASATFLFSLIRNSLTLFEMYCVQYITVPTGPKIFSVTTLRENLKPSRTNWQRINIRHAKTDMPWPQTPRVIPSI
jgi:hypothetical protein